MTLAVIQLGRYCSHILEVACGPSLPPEAVPVITATQPRHFKERG